MCHMAPRKHRSFRFDPAILERLEQRASASGLTVSALVEQYVDEGLRQEDHPGIVFVDGPAGRRARVGGTGLDVWEVIMVVQDNDGSPEEAAGWLHVPQRLVDNGVRYYADYPYEIDHWLAETDRLYEEELQRQRRVADVSR